MTAEILRDGNTINVRGDFGFADLSSMLAAIHSATEKAKYTDITLDFEHCTSAFARDMIPLCAQILQKRRQHIYAHLNLPNEPKLKRLFEKSNWAHLIDPRRNDPAPPDFYNTHIPATQYHSTDEQSKIVNQIVENILGIVPEMQRADFQAFEWAINEVTDNVLTHSFSDIGGVVALTLSKDKKLVEYIVADAGIGIGNSLRSGAYKGIQDVQAVDLAIKEGVTRDKKVGQGNGLFGSFEISHNSNRYFKIRSGHAELTSAKKTLRISNLSVPYNGCLIAGEIDFSIPGLLADALKFSGEKHESPFDYIDHKYHADDQGILRFMVKDETNSFGSRPAGTIVRNKLRQLSAISDYRKIQVSLEGIALISSSFADEAFAKLFKEIGPLTFMGKIELVDVSKVCKDLIDKAVLQRMKVD